MTPRDRFVVAALLLGALLAGVVLVAFASRACPIETDTQPCPDAGRNAMVVIALATLGAALLVTPFAFLAEVGARRGIVYRAAWARAARRGALAGLALAALAGLRLGGALNPAVAIFVVILALIADRLARSLDRGWPGGCR